MQIPFVGVVGLRLNYRGFDLERHLRPMTANLRGELGQLVSEEDFISRKHHTDTDAIPLLGRALTRGEVGCAMGHIAAYRALLDSGQEWGLIVEDDAVLAKPLDISSLSKFFDSPSPKISLLFWDPVTAVGLGGGQLEIFRRQPFGFHRLLVPPTHTVAYAINRSAALSLIEANPIISFPADWPVLGTRGIIFYRSTENFFDHNKTSSRIDQVDEEMGALRSLSEKGTNVFYRALSLPWIAIALMMRGRGPGVLTMALLRPTAFAVAQWVRG